MIYTPTKIDIVNIRTLSMNNKIDPIKIKGNKRRKYRKQKSSTHSEKVLLTGFSESAPFFTPYDLYGHSVNELNHDINNYTKDNIIQIFCHKAVQQSKQRNRNPRYVPMPQW